MVKKQKNISWRNTDNVVGWIGVALVLGAYCLVSFGVVSALTITFQGLTLLGSLGVMVVSYRRKAMQPFTLNLIFAVIACISLIRIIFYL